MYFWLQCSTAIKMYENSLFDSSLHSTDNYCDILSLESHSQTELITMAVIYCHCTNYSTNILVTLYFDSLL